MITVDVIGTTLLSVLAFTAGSLMRRTAQQRTKQLIVQLPDNTTETLILPPGTSDAEIATAVRQGVALEEKVKEAISFFGGWQPSVKTIRGGSPDFLLERGNHRIAIEVKYQLDYVTGRDLLLYAGTSPSIEKLLLVSRQTPSAALVESIRQLGFSDRIKFIKVSEERSAVDALREVLTSREWSAQPAKAYHPA